MSCVGHPCDSCDICSSGGCCGESVLTLDLPSVGSITCAAGTELGRLAVVGGRVLCHVCGESFVELGGHLGQHGLTADAYRAAFDLLSTRGLRAEPRAATYHGGNAAALAEWSANTTTEQRSLIHWNRARRGESRNPRLDPSRQSEFGHRSAERRRADLELERSIRIRVRRAKRLDDPGQTCPECGTMFCTWTSRAGATTNKATTCGQAACVSSARSRAARTRWGAVSPDLDEGNQE